MIHYIFPVPIGEYNLNNHPDLDKLLEIVYKPEYNRKHELLKKGTSSYIARQDILHLDKLKNLKKSIQECINHYNDFLGYETSQIQNSWFNIMGKEGKIIPHQHYGSIISGAFYPLLEENSCNLIFHSPLNNFFHSFIPMKRAKNYTKIKFSVPIKQNYLYLFPSALIHETEKNKSSKRIVLSFNTQYLHLMHW